MNLSATADFPSLCAEYISIAFFLTKTSLIYYEIQFPLSTHIIFALSFDSFKTFWKTLAIVILFLSFKGIAHAYLLWMSITHNKKRIPLLN